MSKIDIIMPVFNTSQYLEKAIESIINQTYQDITLFLIDDGSSDNSTIICQFYADNYDKVIFIKKDNNTGLSDTRNLGLSLSNSKYVMFMDSDDWIDLNTCENLMQQCDKYNVDLIFFNYIKEFNNLSEKRPVFDSNHETEFFNAEKVKTSLLKNIIGLTKEELKRPEDGDRFVTACMKLYKNKIIKKNNIQFIDTKIVGTEDALFNMYYLGKCESAVYLNQYYYHYRRDNEQSLTRNFDNTLYFKWKNMYRYMEEYIDKNQLPLLYKEALTNRIILAIIGVGLNISKSNMSYLEKYQQIKEILQDEIYQQASENLSLQYFSMKWKVFFVLVKWKKIHLLLLLLKVMNYIVYKRKIRSKKNEV